MKQYKLTLVIILFASLLFSCNRGQKNSTDPVQDNLIKATSSQLDQGKMLFNTNCLICHRMDRDMVGPALKGVSYRYSKEWLYAFIRNSQEMIANGDSIAVERYKLYNNSVMTSFPSLKDEEIDAILKYIN